MEIVHAPFAFDTDSGQYSIVRRAIDPPNG